MAQPISVPADVTLPELTFRGVLLGALITVIFTASNVFLGLKVGLTFSSAIPAAVISMSVLRLFRTPTSLKTTWCRRRLRRRARCRPSSSSCPPWS